MSHNPQLQRVRDDLAALVVREPDHKTPGRRGVVTAAGTPEQWLGVWLLVHRLPEVPIEVWRLPHEEAPALPLPACVTHRVLSRTDVRGWALKPHVLWETGFDEALWVDSDVLPLGDLTALLDGPPCIGTDPFRYSDPSVLRAFGADVDAPEWESGLVALSTVAQAAGLQRCARLNGRHRDLIYRHIYGDKETFRLAGLPLQPLPVPEVLGHHGWDVPVGAGRSARIRSRSGRPLPVGLLIRDHGGRALAVHRTVVPFQRFDRRPDLRWVERVPVQSASDWVPAPDGPAPAEVVEAEASALDDLASVGWFAEHWPQRGLAARWVRHRYTLERWLQRVVERR